MSAKGKSPNTKRGYIGDAKTFFDWLDVDEISLDTFEPMAAEHLNHCKYVDRKRSTTARRVSGLRAFARYGHDIYHFLDGYSTPKPAPGEPHPLEEGIDGVFSMIDAAETVENRALIALTGLCGARVSEARELTVEDVDLKTLLVCLGGKRDRWRNVPMSRLAMAHIVAQVIDARVDGRDRLFEFCDKTARNRLKSIHSAAGLTGDGSSHDLRMTFATWVYDRTKDIRLVQDLLGHSSPVTTERYVGIRLESKRRAVEFDLAV